MSYSHPVCPVQTDIQIRLYTRSSHSDSESHTVFILSLFEFIVICPVLGLHAPHLVFRGLTFHILCHSAHCFFNRWLISCLNSHQTQHAISASINSPELMNTIAAFLGKPSTYQSVSTETRRFLENGIKTTWLYLVTVCVTIKNKPKMDKRFGMCPAVKTL